MPKHKVLITVTAYPLPSRSYDELVCTAGLLEDGKWIRIYPVPLKFLMGIRKEGNLESFKYNWIELDLKKRTDDFRPESYSPVKYDFSDVNVIKRIDTKNNWEERKKHCLTNVYTNLTKLINDSKEPTNISLAVFKPTKVLDFVIENDAREWRDEWIEIRKQGDLFQDITMDPKKTIRKVPYKFYYKFVDDEGKESRLMIEDWEIGQLYWNCLKDSKNDEQVALQKVKNKFFNVLAMDRDLYLFLGTTKEWHMRRANNPFVIVGVFYPKIETQQSLFK
jgi:hypothetical protein